MVRGQCDGDAWNRAVWFYLLGLISLAGFIGTCRLESCVNEYSAALEYEGLKGPESTAAYCKQLKAYGACVKAASRSCRGDLQYHSTWSIISTLTKRFDCSRFGVKPHRRDCTYYGRQDYSFCRLYGEPHLLTFSAGYHNCRLDTSKILIDNQFFSAVVTSGKKADSNSTLLTQINITIKAGGTPCASEKHYVARIDMHLPMFFIDETQRGSIKNSIFLNSSREATSETAVIYMRYIDTAIVIKKSGSHFGFSCRMPSDIMSFDPGGSELCRTGCPDDKGLDVRAARAEQLIWKSAVEKCTGDSTPDASPTNWRDWCVFDAISSLKSTTTTTSPIKDQPVSLVKSMNNNNTWINYEDNKVILVSKGFSVEISLFVIIVPFIVLLITR